MSTNLCPGIEKLNLEESLYDIYEKQFQLQLLAVDQMVSCVMLEQAELQKLFEIGETVPAFRVQGVTYCSKDVILEMEDSLYRGDVYSFSVKATS